MPLWTTRDRFVPVAATGLGGPGTGREQDVTARLWNECGSLVTVAATGLGAALGRGRMRINKNRLVETASALIDVHSFTGDEQRLAELMASLFEEMGLQIQWQQVEEGRANALGTWRGTGGGKTLMFNGHMDTSYSGREPWLKDVPGFQPSAFVKNGRLYGLGISNMKGALACYVEAVRSLQDAGVRLRGDVLIAAVCGEIEKTQYADAQGAQYRGYAAGTRYLVSHGGVADMCLLGEPTEGKVVLGHFGTLWLRPAAHGNFIHTAFSEGKRGQNSILRMHEVTNAVLEWIPTWEDDPSNAYRGKKPIVKSAPCAAASAGASRERPTTPISSSTSGCLRPRRWASRAARCSNSCAHSPSASPTTGSRARSMSLRRVRRSTRATSSCRRSTPHTSRCSARCPAVM